MTVVNQNRVNKVYQKLFGRDADGPGLEYWTAMVDANLISMAQLEQDLLVSAEGTSTLRKNISAQYEKTLNRKADIAGVDYWVVQIQQGKVPNDMAALGDTFLTFEQPSPPATPGVPPVDRDTPMPTPESDLPGGTQSPPPAREFLTTSLRRTLENFGITEPAGFLERAVREKWTDDQMYIELQGTAEFKDRFQGMDGRDTPISPEEYVQWEEGAKAIMQEAGFPPGFYDDPSDFVDLIKRGGTLTQLNARVTDAFVRVDMAAPEIKDAFNRMNGVGDGKAALAAFFLDPDRAQPVLENLIARAEVSGSAAMFGLQVDDARAATLAGRGFDAANTQQTFMQLSQQQSVFNESITEQRDLTADVEGVNAAFGLDAAAARDIEQRVRGRVGALSGGGGLGITQTGVGGRSGQ